MVDKKSFCLIKNGLSDEEYACLRAKNQKTKFVTVALIIIAKDYTYIFIHMFSLYSIYIFFLYLCVNVWSMKQLHAFRYLFSMYNCNINLYRNSWVRAHFYEI